VRIVVRTGARLPRTTSAQGKVFLAFGPDAGEVDPGELDRIRETRIAVNSQLIDGIRAIATPVFQDREPVAAMAVVGTVPSLPEHPDSPIAVRLRDAAESLSAELGFLSDERST
jgi:DNA-binding IclR family transcriptional regulator